jgi:hypothetical protein
LFIVGCASTQATRKARYLSYEYDDQVQKNIYVISLIDARTDKETDTQEPLANKNILSYFILNPLKQKGYAPKFLGIDTSECGSLAWVNNISEISCLDNDALDSGELFLLISIDRYSAPKGMGVVGETKVTGTLYTKSLNSFIWKDSI